MLQFCMLTFAYTHSYKCMKPYTWSQIGVQLLSSTLIHHHMAHSSLFPLLICKLPLQQWETWLPPPAILYLLSCDIYAQWYQNGDLTPTGNHFISLHTVSFAFSLRDTNHSRNYIGQHFPPSIHFSEVGSNIYNIVRLFCHILYSILGSSDLLKHFILKLHI